MAEAAKKLGGIVDGGTIQFGSDVLPYAAIVVNLMDHPETVLDRVRLWEEAYQARRPNTQPAAPAASQGAPEAVPAGVGKGFKVGPERWATANRGPQHMTHKVSCTRCKNPNNPKYQASMFGNEIEGQYGASLAERGIDEDAYVCIQKLPDGLPCDHFVLYSHAVSLVP